MEDVRIYDVCLTKKEVLLAKAIIAEKLKKEYEANVKRNEKIKKAMESLVESKKIADAAGLDS